MHESNRKEHFLGWLEKYRALVHKVVRAFASNSEDQKDLFQEVSLQLWRSTTAFEPGGSESTWVYKVALNTAVVFQRKNSRHKASPTIAVEAPEPLAGPAGTEAAEKREMLEMLYSALRKLPEGDRSIMLLNLDGFSNGEIADVVGISPGNAAVRLTRARGKLARLMRRTTDEL